MSSENTLFVDNILDRIKHEKGHRSDADLARFLDVSTAVLSNWRKRNTINYGVVLSKCYDWNMDWLLKGSKNTHSVDDLDLENQDQTPSIVAETPTIFGSHIKGMLRSVAVEGNVVDDALVEVSFYDITATAGHGGINDSFSHEPTQTFTFPASWLRQNGLSLRDTFAFAVSGNSMMPSVRNKDTVLACKASKVTGDDVYLFHYDDMLHVKRIQHISGGLLIISDNDQYKPYKIPATEMDSFSLVARVVRVIRRP